MALTPEGSPYVESSDLVATYPTTSLALANRVDLVGVLPFATSAARATAIPSPTDGQYSYLQDTNLTQFWNGSAWQTAGLTPALTLVTPTSIANSGGSASLSGGEVTFTTITSLSLNGVFTATYQNYLIMMNRLGSAVNGTTVRLRLSGTDSTAALYTNQRIQSFSTTTSSSRSLLATSFIGGQISTVGPNQANMTIYAPNLATNTSISNISVDSSSTDPTLEIIMGHHAVATAYDGITFIPSSPTTMTGTVRVYGYQTS
jgi:hypothetical protein